MSLSMKPEHVKERNKQRIIAALARKGKLRWSELLEESKLSRRALAEHLKEMQGKTVKRTVDGTAKEYPPPVYYELIPGKVKPSDLLMGDIRDFLDVFLVDYQLRLAEKELKHEKISPKVLSEIIDKAKETMLEMYEAHKEIMEYVNSSVRKKPIRE